MLTFKVPAEFRMFMRSHPRECYKALFEAFKETLFALAKDPKYIGSPNIGATGVLHTWGRDLNYHRKKFELGSGKFEKQSGSHFQLQTSNFIHVSPERYEFVQADASECRGIHSPILGACDTERLSKGSSLRLRPSASQYELRVVVDVGNSDTEHNQNSVTINDKIDET